MHDMCCAGSVASVWCVVRCFGQCLFVGMLPLRCVRTQQTQEMYPFLATGLVLRHRRYGSKTKNVHIRETLVVYRHLRSGYLVQ